MVGTAGFEPVRDGQDRKWNERHPRQLHGRQAGGGDRGHDHRLLRGVQGELDGDDHALKNANGQSANSAPIARRWARWWGTSRS